MHGVHEVLARSVLRQATLPHVFRFNNQDDGVDISALGGESGQIVQGIGRSWANAGMDDMHSVEADYVTAEAENRPILSGSSARAVDFGNAVLQGFNETYSILLAHRAEVRDILSSFRGATTRLMVRPTRTYTALLRGSYHPNELRDGLRRDQILDSIWGRGGSGSWTTVPSELEDLRRGDVPVFWTRPEQTHLWSTSSKVTNFLPRSGLEESLDTLNAMSPEDAQRQALLIRLSLSEPTKGIRAREVDSVEWSTPTPADCIGVSLKIGELLADRVVRSREGISWMTMESPQVDHGPAERPRSVSIAGPDLYHGVAGIVLFLAYLGQRESKFRDLASEGVSTMMAMASIGDAAGQPVGPFVGRTAYHFVMHHLAVLWDEPQLLESAMAGLSNLEGAVLGDEHLDIMGGVAGCLVVLLRLYDETGEKEALRLARLCGDRLLKTAQPGYGGVAWQGKALRFPVPGFAHGAAGVSWALVELARTTGDERYLDTAHRGWEFERGPAVV